MNDMSSVCKPRGFWYALATKRCQEDRAIENLIAWGIPTLAPKLDVQGCAECQKPKLLFPGYIFAHFDLLTMVHKIRFTRGVSYIVSFGGRPAEVADEIIAAINQRMDRNGMVTLDKRLEPGDAVIVTSGPLRDFQGIFEQELSDGERVRILLTTVTYTSRIQIDKCNLKKLRNISVSEDATERPLSAGLPKAG